MIYPRLKYWIPNRFGRLSQDESAAEIAYIRELLRNGCDVELHPDNTRYGLPNEGNWPFCRKPHDQS